MDAASSVAVPVESRQRMHDGTELMLRTWEPDPACFDEPLGTAIVIHGLAEHSGRYAHVAARLRGLGLRVRAYDHRGHGASGGKRMAAPHPDIFVDDLAEICDEAMQTWHELPFLVGHSMGGLIAARFATARVRPVRAVVLSSPALGLKLGPLQRRMEQVLLAVAPDLRVPSPNLASELSHDAAVVARFRSDPLVQHTISASVLNSIVRGIEQAHDDAGRLEAPTLMLVAGADTIVDAAGSRRFCGGTPDDLCELVWYDTAYHELFNESEPLRGEVLDKMAGWLQARLQACPANGPTVGQNARGDARSSSRLDDGQSGQSGQGGQGGQPSVRTDAA